MAEQVVRSREFATKYWVIKQKWLSKEGTLNYQMKVGNLSNCGVKTHSARRGDCGYRLGQLT